MRSTVLSHTENGVITSVLVFESGDEVVSLLTRFAREKRIESGHFTAIGAFARGVVAFYDLKKKEYVRIPVEEQVEVLGLIGNISIYNGEPRIHAHVTLGLIDGTTRGGHLMEGIVKPTLEMSLIQSAVRLERSFDEEAGIPLLDIRSQ